MPREKLALKWAEASFPSLRDICDCRDMIPKGGLCRIVVTPRKGPALNQRISGNMSSMEPLPQRVPTIETERLTLRGHRLDDYAASSAMWGDSNVVRYISGNPSSLQQSWMGVLDYVGHWSLMGFGYWVVEETGSRRFVGEVHHQRGERCVASGCKQVWLRGDSALRPQR